MLVRFFEQFFVAPGSILEWFWEAKMGPKIDFLGVLFRMCFLSFFLSIFYRFLECFCAVFEVVSNVFFVIYLLILCCVLF